MRIIKFDHISYIAASENKEKILKKFTGRKLKFSELGIANLESKNLLMCRKDQKVHDMLFFEGEGINIEVILYDKISRRSQVQLGVDTIYAECTNIGKIATCFNEIGITDGRRTKKGIIFNLKGWLDKKDIYLEINEQAKSMDTYLDYEGYGCVTLLVDSLSGLNVISDAENLVTQAESINVNQRSLDVCFWKNTGLNIIFEFITAGKE